jgi:type 1 glutamine amidotransferase
MWATLPVLLLALASSVQVQRERGADLPEVLFFTHSAGYVHDVVRRPAPGQLAPAEQAFSQAAAGRFRVTCSQDCADIGAAGLQRYAAVVFMTTSTQERDLPVPGNGNQELVDWVARGGAFAGVHCATDTNYRFAPYVEMIGGTFDGHPWHEEITLRVEDRGSPVTAGLGESFAITDEIYQFGNFRRHPVRVLLSLDLASVDVALGKREDRDYALAWTRDWGEGRVFYMALGHREEVWKDPRFQALLMNGIAWAIDGPDLPAQPPAGARILFDSRGRSYAPQRPDLGAWKHRDGKPAGWRVVREAMEVAAGTGDLVTREAFGDGLYHVEFMTPAMPSASGQARGNSGVYLQGRYEVQVLDSYGLELGLGDCGSIYGKKVAAVNASRAPERWQSYDIEFRAPRFDSSGARTAGARLTVWHNGIRIHDDFELDGPTAGGEPGEGPTGPLLLQDHGDPVRYRNVWVLPR